MKHRGPHSAYTFLAPTVGLEKIIFFGLLLHFYFIFSSLSVQSVRSCQNFARDRLLSRDASESSREDSLCSVREDSSARESPPESCFFARALYDFARDCLSVARPRKDLRARLFNFARSGNRLRARLYNFARSEIFLRADYQDFARDPATTTLFFLHRFCVFSDFCC